MEKLNMLYGKRQVKSTYLLPVYGDSAKYIYRIMATVESGNLAFYAIFGFLIKNMRPSLKFS